MCGSEMSRQSNDPRPVQLRFDRDLPSAFYCLGIHPVPAAHHAVKMALLLAASYMDCLAAPYVLLSSVTRWLTR